MTRTLLLVGFCSLGLAQSGAISSAPADWRFAHPDADMKISVNFQTVLKSEAFIKGFEQSQALKKGNAQGKDNGVQVELVMGLLRTVDRVSVSAHQKAPNDMDVLAEVTGSFDPQLIAGFFPSTGKSQVKSVGPHTILIGEGDSFTQAVARMAGPASANEAAADEAGHDLWIEGSAAFLAKQSGQPLPPMLQSVRGFAMGLTLSESPVFDLVLNAADDSGAGQILTMLQAMAPLLTASPATASAAKGLTFKQDGTKVRARFVMPPEMVTMLQQQAVSAANGATSGAGGLAQLAPLLGSFGIGGGSSPKPVPAAPPPPQNGGKIMIYGLDDGPKQLPGPK